MGLDIRGPQSPSKRLWAFISKGIFVLERFAMLSGEQLQVASESVELLSPLISGQYFFVAGLYGPEAGGKTYNYISVFSGWYISGLLKGSVKDVNTCGVKTFVGVKVLKSKFKYGFRIGGIFYGGERTSSLHEKEGENFLHLSVTCCNKRHCFISGLFRFLVRFLLNTDVREVLDVEAVSCNC